MELNIERLHLTLPPALAGRAEAIGRALGEELARLPLSRSQDLAHLAVPPLVLDGQATDASIARAIATAVHRQLGGTR